MAGLVPATHVFDLVFKTWRPTTSAGMTRLLTFLADAVECLRKTFERILVDRQRTAAGSSFHRQFRALAHGIHHTRLFGHVLDPGAVVLSVHRELGSTYLCRGVRAGLERIADRYRDLVPDVVGGAGRDEHVGRIALAALRLGLRRFRLAEHETYLIAAGGGGVGAPIGVLPEQLGLPLGARRGRLGRRRGCRGCGRRARRTHGRSLRGRGGRRTWRLLRKSSKSHKTASNAGQRSWNKTGHKVSSLSFSI